MTPLVFRFFVGGVVVSIFAILKDLLKPKSFAGLFGVAPSVALAMIGQTILTERTKRFSQPSTIGAAIAPAAFSSQRLGPLPRQTQHISTAVSNLLIPAQLLQTSRLPHESFESAPPFE